MELDILPDGSLDLADAVLEGFDIVLVSVPSRLDMPKPQMTKRVLKALAHPTGRLLNKRQPVKIDLKEVFHVARERDIAVEIDAPNYSGSISTTRTCIGRASSA